MHEAWHRVDVMRGGDWRGTWWRAAKEAPEAAAVSSGTMEVSVRWLSDRSMLSTSGKSPIAAVRGFMTRCGRKGVEVRQGIGGVEIGSRHGLTTVAWRR